MLRVDVQARVQAGDHFTVLGEVRSENGGQPGPYALYLRIRPWTARALRHPGRAGSADLRRVSAAHVTRADNPLIGYPLAYQYLTSHSRRRDCRPAPTNCCRCAAAAGCPLTRSAIRPRDARRAARQRVPLGHRCAGARRQRPRRRHGVDHGRNAVEPAASATTTAAGRWPAASTLRPVAGLIVGASAARGPFVVETARARGARRRRRSTSSRRRRGAATSSIRGITTACGSRRSSATGRMPLVERAAHRRCRCERSPRRSRAATSCGRACTSRRGSIIWGSARSPARRDADLGCAGDADRGRRRVFPSAQSAAEARGSVQRARRRPDAEGAASAAAQLVFWF